MFTDPFETLSAFEKAATVALYLTVALFVVGTVIGILLKKFRPENYRTFPKQAMAFAAGYAIGLIVLLMVLKLSEDGIEDMNTFIPIVVILAVMLAMVVAALIVAVVKPSASPLFAKISVAVIGVGILALFIGTMVNYSGAGYVERTVWDEVQLYLYTVLLIAAIVLLAVFCGKKTKPLDSKGIVYAALCIAMSFALSYIRFLQLPQGGSITLASLLPLMVFSYMYGIRKGVMAGVIYGFLQFIQAPWFTHPVQFLLDYPIAFGAIGLAGMFKDMKLFEKYPVVQILLGGVVGVIIRYFSHVVSGIFVFGSSDPENYGAVAWSFLYNSFAFGDMAIALAAGCALFASKNFLRALTSATVSRKNEASATDSGKTNASEAAETQTGESK